MGALGGLEGRALVQGDRLGLLRSPVTGAGRRLKPSARPVYEREWEVRAMRGPQAAPDYLTEADMQTFFGRPWPVDRNSNRTASGSSRTSSSGPGGAEASPGGHPSNILDNSYPVGAVNVNGDLPVILGPDGPTGGRLRRRGDRRARGLLEDRAVQAGRRHRPLP
jgi:allophanate hydrolase subunit 2